MKLLVSQKNKLVTTGDSLSPYYIYKPISNSYCKSILAILLMSCVLLFGANLAKALVVINAFNEDFSVADFGHVGPGIAQNTDVSSADITLNSGNGNYTASSDFFRVSGGVLQWQDVDGDTLTTTDHPRYVSPTIAVPADFGVTNGEGNPAALTFMHVSFDAFGSGTFETDGGVGSRDDFEIRLFGDGALIYTSNLIDDNNFDGSSFINGDRTFNSQRFSSGYIDVNSNGPPLVTNFRIEISANNYAGAELFTVDNLVVEYIVTPEPSRALLAMLGMAMMLLRRRRS